MEIPIGLQTLQFSHHPYGLLLQLDQIDREREKEQEGTVRQRVMEMLEFNSRAW